MNGAAIVHHADCDGFLMHSVEIVRGAHGMKHAVCVLECGWRYPEVGEVSRTRPDRDLRSRHGGSDKCAGQCAEWA